MALPKLDQPTYTLTVPSTGNEITYRPFVVKEEKILMMAQEDGSTGAISQATKQVIGNCLVSGELDVERLASCDIEWIFLHLRARSVGETVDLTIPCEECDTKVEFTINVNDAVVHRDKVVDPKIELTPEVGIVLRLPEVNDMTNLNSEGNELDDIFKLIALCTESIYDADNIYTRKDVSLAEIEEWIQSLSQEQFTAIREFFDSIPKVKLTTDIVCPKCSHQREIVLEGLRSFFS